MVRTRGASPPVGVLGLQGDFDAHRQAFEEIDVPVRVVRFARELDGIGGLVIPGGESTTLLKLMLDVGFEDPLRRFHASGGPIFGTCAGAILLAAKVSNPGQFSFGFIDIDVERNAYGRQRESFETARGRVEEPAALPVTDDRDPTAMELVLIRAPRISRCGAGVQVMVSHHPEGAPSEPVLVRQGWVLAGTFHPELGRDRRIHRCFAELAHRRALAA